MDHFGRIGPLIKCYGWITHPNLLDTAYGVAEDEDEGNHNVTYKRKMLSGERGSRLNDTKAIKADLCRAYGT